MFITIDVEGFEPEVLRGLSRPLRALSCWVLPSPEVTALLALFCLTARLGWRVPRGVTAALADFFIFTRLLRIADGVNMRYCRHPFIIVSDARPLLELPRLLATSMPMWLLVLLPVVIVAAVCLVLSWLVPPLPVTKPHQLDHRLGVFGTSVAARWAQEVDFALHVSGYRDDKVRPRWPTSTWSTSCTGGRCRGRPSGCSWRTCSSRATAPSTSSRRSSTTGRAWEAGRCTLSSRRSRVRTSAGATWSAAARRRTIGRASTTSMC